MDSKHNWYADFKIERGDGIVSGGALNVDYFATDEALKLNPTADKIKIFIPVVLDLYVAHYRKRATEGVITPKQAEALVVQLESLRAANPDALIGNPQNTADTFRIFAGTGENYEKSVE